MQAFKDAPIWLKILMILAVGVASCITGYMGIETYLNKQSNGSSSESTKPTNSELQNINFTIQEKSAPNLISNVDVQIISEGPPTLKKTDSNGYLEIQIPTRKTVSIILMKTNYKTEIYYVNLQNDPKTTRTFYMEPQIGRVPRIRRYSNPLG